MIIQNKLIWLNICKVYQKIFQMNKILPIIICVFIGLQSFAPPVSPSIVNAIKTGNSGELAKFFDTSIELSVLGSEGAYSKSQAEQIIKTFFSKNTPTSFKIMHNGDSKNGTHYTIGNLTSSTAVYRVYIVYKDHLNSSLILELRVEKDE